MGSCQRQPRREHRESPRTPQRRAACRRPAGAARHRSGHATHAALPMPALRRPHDRDRDLRARLRAEMAPDAEQDRHVMSQIAREPRTFLVPMRWPYAGSDPSRPCRCGRCAVRSLIRSARLPRCPLRASNLASERIRRPHPAGVTSTLKVSAGIKSP
jgi:hypothetical protein